MNKEVKIMCKQAIVLDTIKKTVKKGGMSSAQIKLAEAQSEDYADMKREIQEIRTYVGDVKNKVTNVEVQLAEMKGTLNILLENSKTKESLLNNKYFWIVLTVVICLFAGVTHITEIAHLFGK